MTIAPILSALSSHGPMSARDIASATESSLAQVLASIHDTSYSWWDIEQIAGPNGWLYRQRQVLGERVRKPVDTRKEYANSRIGYPAGYSL